jgi:uncharacterized membrane protein YkvA (DUF1232 family)
MSPLVWLLVAMLAVYLAFVLALLVAGRRTEARALAGFIPDCLVLFRRLIGDPRVPRQRKVLLGLVVVYLASPIDLVPDFIPVAGQLDDVIIVALALRAVLGADDELLRQHWPGPGSSLRVIQRFVRPTH